MTKPIVTHTVTSPDASTIRVTLVLQSASVAALQRIADGRSLSHMVRKAIDRFLNTRSAR